MEAPNHQALIIMDDSKSYDKLRRDKLMMNARHMKLSIIPIKQWNKEVSISEIKELFKVRQ